MGKRVIEEIGAHKLEQVFLSVEDHIAVMTLHNPPVNAASGTVQEEILLLCDYINHDDDIWVCVMHSDLKTFCVGVDIKRFYQSILYDGSMWQGEEIITRVGVGSPNEIDTSSDSDVTNTGYYTRKTIDESVNGADNLQMSNGMANYIFFRYADVLLMYAEASLEAGDKPTAIEYLDMVRTRGDNMPSINDTYPQGITESQLREIIRRDRRIELAFEDKRWWDILRWKICDGENGVMNKPIGGMKIEDTNGDGVWEYNYHEVGKRTFLPRMYYQPIPQYVIDKNPVIREQNGGEDGWVNGQNPGY